MCQRPLLFRLPFASCGRALERKHALTHPRFQHITMRNHSPKFLPLLLLWMLLLLPLASSATTFYISTSSGNDTNGGKSPAAPWQTTKRVNDHFLEAGDSVLFHAGETFTGQLHIRNEGGAPGAATVISTYGKGSRPVLDGDGYLATILIENSGYIHLSELEIKNDGGPAKPGNSEKLRYGLYLVNTFADGTTFDHFRFSKLTFRNIYSTIAVNDNDQTGVNAHAIKTKGSGYNPPHPVHFRDMRVEDCFFTRTGRHAVVIGTTNQLTLRNNLFRHVGGAGMVIAAHARNILVEGNVTDHTGSDIDPRMAARGSGLWAYRTTNLTAQNNRFMHARGFKDSFGMHIDIGNRNVVYQYNYSEDNEGGFVEILGGNRNVGYRYNVSIGDGWRMRPPQPGRTFWVGGWSGKVNQPVASDSVFIYNNSVYIPDSVAPRIWIEGVTKNTRIYNNIVYVANEFSQVYIKNDAALNDFSHNLWYGNIAKKDTDGEAYQGTASLRSDPLFATVPPLVAEDFRLLSAAPGIKSGKLVYNPKVSRPFDGYDNHGGRDFFGNWVSFTHPSNIGAYNGPPVSAASPYSVHLEMYKFTESEPPKFTLQIPTNMRHEQLLLELIDTSGQVVFTLNTPGKQQLEFEPNHLIAGSYLLKISGGDYRMQRWIMVGD